MYNHVKVGDRVRVRCVRDAYGTAINDIEGRYLEEKATVTRVFDIKDYFPGIWSYISQDFDVINLDFDDDTLNNLTWWRSDDVKVIGNQSTVDYNKQDHDDRTEIYPEIGHAVIVTTDRYLPGIKPGSCKYVTGISSENPHGVYVIAFSTEFNTDFEIPLDKEDYYLV